MAIQAGFTQAVRGLAALRKCDGFEKSEIDRLRALTNESRAAVLSYLTSIVETSETNEAAGLQSRRLKRERREER